MRQPLSYSAVMALISAAICLVTSSGVAWLACMAIIPSIEGGYPSVLPGLLLIGIGMGLVMTPSTVLITESLPVEKQGVASALNDTVRELGGAIGVALIGSVLSSGYGSSIAPVASTLPEALRGPVEGGIGTALATAPQLGAQAPTVVGAARQAFVDGWHQAMWVGAAIAVAAVVLLLFTGPRDPKPAEAVDAAPAVSR